jgi:hypothetical protein
MQLPVQLFDKTRISLTPLLLLLLLLLLLINQCFLLIAVILREVLEKLLNTTTVYAPTSRGAVQAKLFAVSICCQVTLFA